jgi:hypothetical protein
MENEQMAQAVLNHRLAKTKESRHGNFDNE